MRGEGCEAEDESASCSGHHRRWCEDDEYESLNTYKHGALALYQHRVVRVCELGRVL